MNLDGVVETADVAPFLELLVAGGTTATVPEPGTAALPLAAAGVLRCRRSAMARR